ncbi:MAG: hypothetical protein ACREJO_01985 [Phycisphaerales bacterium]
MEQLDRRVLLAGAGVAGALALAKLAKAGPLTPPAGAVASTGKTLNQVEPRTDVATLAGSASAVHVISQPGSYYLTTNVQGVAGKNGIEIQASDVTLDLNGFAVQGVAGAIDAITAAVGTVDRKNICVMNGTIRGWAGVGINAFFDADSSTYGSAYRDLRISDCQDGIRAARAVVESCVLHDNSGTGCNVYESTVANCTAVSNGTGFGIYFSSKISGCAAKFNGTGIDCGGGAHVEGNAVEVSFGTGIFVREHCRVVGNSVADCNGDGIRVDTLSGAGGNVIENNFVANCTGIGYNVPAIAEPIAANLVVRNRATQNGTNFSIDLGTNSAGPIVDLDAPGSLTGYTASSHPMANLGISYG